MSKMKYRLEKNRDIYLGNTKVENLFINEYMPVASGDFVKVYLYGLMYAQNEVSLNLKEEAKILDLTEAEIMEALDYWERKNLVRVYEEEGAEGSKELVIEYVSQVNSLYGIKTPKTKGTDAKAFASSDDGSNESRESMEAKKPKEVLDYEDEDLSDDERLWAVIKMQIANLYHEYEMASGQIISHREMEKIEDLVKLYDINPDLVSYAIKVSKERDKLNINYISTVAFNWKKAGCNNMDDVKKHEDKYSKTLAYHKAVFDRLGFNNRAATDGNKEMMNRWITELGFTIEDVLSACDKAATKREPSLSYVDTVLRNKYKELGGIKVDAAGASYAGAGASANNNFKNNTGGNANANQARRADNSGEESSNVSKGVLKEYLEYIRDKSAAEHNQRVKSICERIPEINKIFDMQARLSDEIIKLGIGRDVREERTKLRDKRKELEQIKKQLLVQNGFPQDYLNRQYLCEKCKDTGTLEDGRNCTCIKQRAEEAHRWNRKRS